MTKETLKATLFRTKERSAVVEFSFKTEDGEHSQTVEHEPAPAEVRVLTWGVSTYNSWFRPEGVEELHEPDETIILEAGWTLDLVDELFEIGTLWHLNHMQAGCAHQTVEYETDRYGRRVPSLDQTKPCAESDYRYGTAWLVKVLPPEVEARVREIFETVGG